MKLWRSAKVALANLTGLGSGIATFLATPTSANLAAAVTNETGTAGALVFSNNPFLTRPSYSVELTITAAGTDQASATLIVNGVLLRATTVASGTGVRFGGWSAGQIGWIMNSGANDLLLYPIATGTINGLVANTPVTIAVGETHMIWTIATNTWLVFRISV